GINNTLTLRHFAAVLTDQRPALLDTISLAVMAAMVAAIAGTLVAYYVARTEFALRNVLDFVVSLPLAIPGTVIGLGFALALNPSPLVLTGPALIIVIAFSVRSLPYSVRSGVVAMAQLHRSLDETS